MLPLSINPRLSQASRFAIGAKSSTNLRAIEALILLSGGALAICSIAFLHFSLRMPGSAILRSTLPILCAIALVPRQGAGLMVSIGAALTSGVLWTTSAELRPAAAASVIALGPMVDLTTQAWTRFRIPVFVCCALAGVAANVLAYFIRFGLPLNIFGSSGNALTFSTAQIFASFVLCGFLSGLLFSAVAFRTSGESSDA